MQVVINSRVIYHDRLGALHKGRTVDVPDSQAAEWLARGWATRYETKVIQDRPMLAAGIPSSASPAAQVSQPQTSSSSNTGAKKRGRTRKEA